jgi:hypothetical protein
MEAPPPALYVFDACSLLNLIASRRFADIIRELACLLRDVEERATFRPGRHDPLQGWWETTRSHL